MMRTLYIFLLLFSAAIGISGCDPYRFTMPGNEFLQCRILSDFHLVEHTKNSIDLSPGGTVVLTAQGVTQFRTLMWIKLDSGTGMKMLVRPRVEESVLDSGYVITMTTSGTSIDSAGIHLARYPDARLKSEAAQMLSVYNEERFIEVVLGCDTIIKSFSSPKAPDDIVFKSMERSAGHIYVPNWHGLDFRSKEETPDVLGRAH
jgi:hypothetical protein